MGLYKIKFCLVVIAFINAVTTRVFGDDRIPAKKRISSDIREPRPYLSISLFYITFYIARVTVAVRNQKKKMFLRDKKCIVTYTTFFLLDQKKEIHVQKYQISAILPSH
jgi:hypothetical protein